MPKNKTGGRNNRKRAAKNSQPMVRMNVRQAQDGETVAIVTKLNGNGRADVKCVDGVTRLLEIRKKFRGRNKRDNMIAMGTIVLVGQREWEVRAANKKEKVDLLYVYSLGQHESLKQNNKEVKSVLFGEIGGDGDCGFDISNRATWKQKVEEENNSEESKNTLPSKIEAVGLAPIDDAEFDFDDI